ncbi:hypothetical protein [Companilactobacillus zhongbaensis]|uniref:hypothetical protein n=1 Tax=Companilactobacillus zhongbaensis TaxID=2486009 RepID=UPI000F7B4426|nr:hypothetical protein [Companilactobacillus zhongbaensis]
MKKKRTGLSIIIGGLVIVVLLAAYTSYKSYTNIGVGGDDPKVETTNTKSTKSQKSPKKDHKGPNKKDSNIFLQDTKNPDRIIAIHPYGSDGVYLYRTQANGAVYPEYKYFNASLQQSNTRLAVQPIGNSIDTQSMTFIKNQNGLYVDNNTGKTYTQLNNHENDKDYNTLDIRNHNKDVLNNTSDPTHDETTNDSSKNDLRTQHHYIILKNGNYYDQFLGTFYGKYPQNYTYDELLQDGSQYIDHSQTPSDDVMYYKDNNQTHVTNSEVDENIEWNKAYDQKLSDNINNVGEKVQNQEYVDSILNSYTEDEKESIMNSLHQIDPSSSNYISTTDDVTNFMHDIMG